jgi:hypothetical protein
MFVISVSQHTTWRQWGSLRLYSTNVTCTKSKKSGLRVITPICMATDFRRFEGNFIESVLILIVTIQKNWRLNPRHRGYWNLLSRVQNCSSNRIITALLPVVTCLRPLTFMEPCIARCVFYITNEMQLIQCSLLLSVLYMFRAVFPPIIRSL